MPPFCAVGTTVARSALSDVVDGIVVDEVRLARVEVLEVLARVDRERPPLLLAVELLTGRVLPRLEGERAPARARRASGRAGRALMRARAAGRGAGGDEHRRRGDDDPSHR